MKAMVLAAGLGTRLRPLTSHRPKALVNVAGHTLLELTLTRLRDFGIRDVIINTHHFAELFEDYLREHDHFGMRIAISREEVLLDTGGGLKHAAQFFLSSTGDPNEPFLLHNVDVLSTIDFAAMLKFHVEHDALATLGVRERPTSRYLLFDCEGQLCGRRTGVDGIPELVRDTNHTQALAFGGIHVLSTRIFDLMTEEGAFSIIPTYLRLAGMNERILAFSTDQYYWRDLGLPEHIEQAARDIAAGIYPV